MLAHKLMGICDTPAATPEPEVLAGPRVEYQEAESSLQLPPTHVAEDEDGAGPAGLLAFWPAFYSSAPACYLPSTIVCFC
eukprot:scaffold273271_cov14-Tisochrysis_lutea.AAC.2